MSAARVALAVALCGCSYDLELLRGRRTDAGGVDRVEVSTPPDVVMVIDRPAPDVAPDLPPVDTGPARMPMTNACSQAVAGTIPTNANGVSVIEGNTTGGIGPFAPACGTMISANSTRIYRYEVRNGGRLVATTNTGLCGSSTSGAGDTLLAAYFSCEASGIVPGSRSCNDDDSQNLCTACGSTTNSQGCGGEHATIELTNLVARDVVYFVVASYNTGGTNPRGPFRLSVAEGGLTPVAPPTMGMPAPRAVNRCACSPALSTAMTRDVEFPRTGMGDQNQLQNPMSRGLFGPRNSPLGTVWAVSARLHLSLYNVSNTGPCMVPGGAKAALDLILGTQGVVASVQLDGSVGAGAVTIPFTAFAPVMLPTGAPTTFEYRIRNIDPMASNCVALDVDLAAPNTVTLYGSM